MKIILPLSVPMPTKKQPDRVWVLNLNLYRNAHFQLLNKAKILWEDIVYRGCQTLKWNDCFPSTIDPGPYRFTYTVFPGSNRKFDLANVLSIVQKFTDDALINLKVIPDDSYKVIPEITYRFGGVDKANPRVELVITSLADCDISDTFKTADEIL